MQPSITFWTQHARSTHASRSPSSSGAAANWRATSRRSSTSASTISNGTTWVSAFKTSPAAGAC
eukprot:9337276-Lingulodinium_polyedra.AAC.1